MKKYLLIAIFGLAIVASVAYARRGASSVFTFVVHPLSGYGDQIVEPPPALLQQSSVEGLGLFE